MLHRARYSCLDTRAEGTRGGGGALKFRETRQRHLTYTNTRVNKVVQAWKPASARPWLVGRVIGCPISQARYPASETCGDVLHLHPQNTTFRRPLQFCTISVNLCCIGDSSICWQQSQARYIFILFGMGHLSLRILLYKWFGRKIS